MLFNSSVGIDINHHEIHISCLKGSFQGMTLAAAASCSLDKRKPNDEQQSDTIQFINGFFAEHKISAANIFIGISSEHLMMREITFPLAVRENLRTTLIYEIEKYLPVSVDDIYFDFHLISEDKEEKKLTILLFAITKKNFERYLNITEKIDPGVSGIEIIQAAEVNYFLSQHTAFQDDAILLYANTFRFDVAIMKNRSMVYATSMAASECTLFENKGLIRLRETFFPESPDATLIIYGISASDDRLRPLSTEFKEIIYAQTDPFTPNAQVMPALGLALKGMKKVPVAMNLMPAHLRKKPNRIGVYLMFILAALLLLAGALWGGSDIYRRHQTLKSLDIELIRLKDEVSVLEQLQEKTRQMRQYVGFLQSLRPGNAYLIEVIDELSRIIPSNAWLTEFQLDGEKLHLYGLAESASSLIPILESSAFFADVEFLSAIRKDREGKELFRIGCKLQAVQ